MAWGFLVVSVFLSLLALNSLFRLINANNYPGAAAMGMTTTICSVAASLTAVASSRLFAARARSLREKRKASV
jgi:hypothetical protein